MSADQDRENAYLRGELSLEEARAFEAELAKEGMTEAVMPDEMAAKVGAAMKELDAVEARRRRKAPLKGYVVAVLAAAAIAALVMWAWVTSGPEEPTIARPGAPDATDVHTPEPMRVPPPTQISIDDTSAAEVGPDASKIAEHDTVEPSLGADAGPSPEVLDKSPSPGKRTPGKGKVSKPP